VKKYGSTNGWQRQSYVPLNLERLQYYIDIGQLDPSKTITIRYLKDSKVLPNLRGPVKLLAKGSEAFNRVIDIEVNAASKTARAAVEKMGGKVKTVYMNKLGLRTILRKPLDEITIGFANAPKMIAHRYDITQLKL